MKLKICFSLLFGLFLSEVYLQTKGVSVLNSNDKPISNSTYAVVVGISDYQDENIPDLRFADKDAEAFANFLKSKAGGSLNNDHLKLMLNQNATAGQVIAALTWLLDECKPGDQAIIYFSGHGDVEAKLLNQLGFLLLWDSPARAYLAGALPVDMLRQVVSTLSIEMKTKVFVIVDACRAGKLAGNTVIGTQLTSNQLAQQFSSEQKILSCQPNEFSIEGEQWGGGRGAFSYHLINGFYGMADADHNGQVSLFEIGRYLEDRVPREVSPLSQMPLTVGEKTAKLFTVDEQTLTTLEKLGTPPAVIARVEQRGFLNEVLEKADSTVKHLYAGFARTLNTKQFLEPEGDCVEFYYKKLYALESISSIRPMLNRNYAAALQDDAQQVLNIMLKSGLTSEVLSAAKAAVIYRNYPTYLARAAELLGKGHYMYGPLKAREFYFEGILQTDVFKKKEQFFKALQWQNDMPYVYAGLIDQYPAEQADSAEYYTSKAMQIAPAWVKPYLNLSYFYQQAKRFDKAEEMLNKAFQVDSNSILAWYKKARYYSYLKKYDTAEYWYLKAIAASGTEICFPCACIDLANGYLEKRRYDMAEHYYKKAIELDSTVALTYSNLANVYTDTRRFTEAEQLYKKSIGLDSTNPYFYNSFGDLCKNTGRYSEAEQFIKKAIQLDSTNFHFYVNLGNVYTQTRRYAEAEPLYKKAIQVDSTSPDPYINLGNLYFESRRFEEAEQLLKKSVEVDSMSPNPYIGLARIYSDHFKRYTEAEQLLNKAISLDSTYAIPYQNLGNLYLDTRRISKAEEQYNKALQLDSNLAFAHRKLGVVYFNTGRFEEAEQQFRKTLQLKSTDELACINLAVLQIRKNRIDESFDYLEKALKYGFSNIGLIYQDSNFAPLRMQTARWESMLQRVFVPDIRDANAWNTLGQLYIMVGNYTLSEAALNKALSINPKSAVSQSNLGFVYLKLARYPESEVALKRAIDLDSTFFYPRKHLGMTYFKTNRMEEARLHFLKAIELNPNYTGAILGMAYLLSSQGKFDEALDFVRQAIDKGARREQLEQDEDLALLIGQKEKWIPLMEKYFSTKIKNE